MIFLDIITNDRFGAGEWVKTSDIDTYSLYRVSKYCDELVPDGKEALSLALQLIYIFQKLRMFIKL